MNGLKSTKKMNNDIDKKNGAEFSEIDEWKPSKPTSKGATAYHDAVVNAGYYKDNLYPLTDLIKDRIKENETIVDFGAGTGVSALHLLNKLKTNFNLILVDNSAAWLGKAYEVLMDKPNVHYYLLQKKNGGYQTLTEVIRNKKVDHVISANTLHLIPDLYETLKGINATLKPNGSFIFQSGNIEREGRKKGVLMVDDTVKRVHDIALDIIRTDEKFLYYRKDLDNHLVMDKKQRKFVFPDPRHLQYYIEVLKEAGFEPEEPQFKLIKIPYKDWLYFLRVKRMQAGILPEIGGTDPTPQEIIDRDIIITRAAHQLFKELETKNPMADKESFTSEWIYLSAKKKKDIRLMDYMFNISGKVALVTGASRGIGKATAIELAKNKINVVINYNKNKKEALEVVEEIKKYGVQCFAIKADVSVFEECKTMINTIKEKFNGLDILVNNAGILKDKKLDNMERSIWEKVININLNSMYYVTKNALEVLREDGRIINISSIIGLDGNFGQTNYAASKAGIIGFTKSLAKEVATRRITVNAIAPGFIKTKMTDEVPNEKIKMIKEMIPIKGIGMPEDIAHVVAFLASEKSRYITGSVIRVDGGLDL